VAFTRAGDWLSITNFGSEPVRVPSGQLLLTSNPLLASRELPADTTAWLWSRST
jgi:alpha-glucosidase